MIGDDAALTVRFDPGLPTSARAELVALAERATGLSPKVGWDLGHLGEDDLVSVTVSVFTITGVLDADERIQALQDGFHALLRGVGGVRVELKNTSSGSYARFESDSADQALLPAAELLARWRDDRRAADAAPSVSRRLTILSVCDEWFPASGGISAFNRYLCGALAGAGHSVLCLLPGFSAEEFSDAEASGVRLVSGPVGFSDNRLDSLVREPQLPLGLVPDVVIGHSRFTGPAARVLTETVYRDAKRLHFIHMHPDRIEWGKPDGSDIALTSEQRTRHERDLCEQATATIAVGPLLHDFALSKLTYPSHVPDALQIIPGFDHTGERRRERRGPALVMALGRVHNPNKGLDLAAKAIGHAIRVLKHSEDDMEIYVRGVPAGESGEVREAVLKWSEVPGLTTSLRNYSGRPGDVLDDFSAASLLIMASREEDFGLVGYEAVRAGVPALVSHRSGLGKVMRSSLPKNLASQVVVDVSKHDPIDVPLWASRISWALHDREAAFDVAENVRTALAEAHPWSAAVVVVEQAVQQS